MDIDGVNIISYHASMVNIVYNRNCVYQIAYHVVWCVKYRKPLVIGLISQRVDELISEICSEHKWVVISKEVQPEHIHLFVTISPATSIATAIKKLKGITARKLFIEFPDLKKELWGGSLWSPSYYVGTAGNVSAQTIKKYIERADHLRNRR